MEEKEFELTVKILRFAGFQLPSQVIAMLLNKEVRGTIDTVLAFVKQNPDPKASEIDALVDSLIPKEEKEEKVDVKTNLKKA